MIVFAGLIAAGFWVLITRPPTLGELTASFQPFLETGGQGLVQAMGYTFIALQGFDLIAAVGGEVKRPERTIPRAMLLSLGVALVIYLPLLCLIVALGRAGPVHRRPGRREPGNPGGGSRRQFSRSHRYWLIVVAGVLSMLSALHANLLAASRFARTMASHRTLPRWLDHVTPDRGTPVRAIQLTGVTVGFLLIAVPDVAAAGAMSGLIFLASFAIAHGIAYLVRTRAGDASPFQTPAFPLIPAVGGVACLSLAMFQALAVPSAGVLAALWLSLGAILYVTQFAHGARVVDASSEALDPQLMRLRGRDPLTLVPIANPASTETLVTMGPRAGAPIRVTGSPPLGGRPPGRVARRRVTAPAGGRAVHTGRCALQSPFGRPQARGVDHHR